MVQSSDPSCQIRDEPPLQELDNFEGIQVVRNGLQGLLSLVSEDGVFTRLLVSSHKRES